MTTYIIGGAVIWFSLSIITAILLSARKGRADKSQ